MQPPGRPCPPPPSRKGKGKYLYPNHHNSNLNHYGSAAAAGSAASAREVKRQDIYRIPDAGACPHLTREAVYGTCNVDGPTAITELRGIKASDEELTQVWRSLRGISNSDVGTASAVTTVVTGPHESSTNLKLNSTSTIICSSNNFPNLNHQDPTSVTVVPGCSVVLDCPNSNLDSSNSKIQEGPTTPKTEFPSPSQSQNLSTSESNQEDINELIFKEEKFSEAVIAIKETVNSTLKEELESSEAVKSKDAVNFKEESSKILVTQANSTVIIADSNIPALSEDPPNSDQSDPPSDSESQPPSVISLLSNHVGSERMYAFSDIAHEDLFDFDY